MILHLIKTLDAEEDGVISNVNPETSAKPDELIVAVSVFVVLTTCLITPFICEKSILLIVPASDTKNSSVSAGVAAKAS